MSGPCSARGNTAELVSACLELLLSHFRGLCPRPPFESRVGFMNAMVGSGAGIGEIEHGSGGGVDTVTVTIVCPGKRGTGSRFEG